jgi:uncharacterized delta-60 repeat protein
MNGNFKTSGLGRFLLHLRAIGGVTLLLTASAVAGPQPGTVDINFNANLASPPQSVLVQPDGKILNGVSRLLTNGAPDPSFSINLPAGASVAATALQPDGRLIVAGEFLTVGGVPRPCLARVDTNGALDLSFVPELTTTNPPPLPPPNPPPSHTNYIGSVLLQSDGKILIGGLKNLLATNGDALPNIVRLNSDGSRDQSFGITNPAGTLTTFTGLQPDGKILVAHMTYTNLSTFVGSDILRFNTNGTLDSTFASRKIAGWVNVISFQNGKLIVGGNPQRINGVKCGCIARLLSDGTLDATFDSDTYATGTGVAAILVQSDDRILIGGGFKFQSVPCENLARLNADGSFDSTYMTNGAGGAGNSGVYSLVQQPDGKVLVGGDYTILNGTPVSYLGRLNGDSSDGPGWIEFDPPTYEVSEGAGVVMLTLRRTGGSQGDVAVNFHTENGEAIGGSDFQSQSGVVVFHDGETEQQIFIEINDDTEIEDLESFRVVLSDPSGGAALGFISEATVFIQDNDGPAGQDSDFAPLPDGIDLPVEAIALQSDGKILIGGNFLQVGRVSRYGVARLQPDGSLDTAFDPGSGLKFNGNPADARLIRIQGDGEILIAGAFNSVNGLSRNHIARLNTNGVLDASFDAGTGAVYGGTVADIRGMEMLTNGQIIVSGGFTTFNGMNRNGLARLNTSGGVDLSYNPAGGQPIQPFGLSADGKVTYTSLFLKNVSRINADGSLDNANLANASSSIYNVQCLSNGNSFICGPFTNVSGSPRVGIARLLPGGTVDPAFVPDLSVFAGTYPPYIYLFAPQPDGKVLIALKSFGTPAGNFLARLNADGSLDTDFEPVRFAIPSGDNDTISALAIQNDGRILVGGQFQTVNGLLHPYLVRLRGGGNSGARKLAIKSLVVSTNQCQITLNVVAGKSFVLQTSTDLLHWVSLSTNIVPVSTFTVLDNQINTGQPRYYRAMQVMP